jgi:hypothetical protein
VGRYNGGDGVVREVEFLRPLAVGILSERRAVAPFGLLGGGDGQRGLNLLVRRDGRVVNLGGKATVMVQAGGWRRHVLRAGGGGQGECSGWGAGGGSLGSCGGCRPGCRGCKGLLAGLRALLSQQLPAESRPGGAGGGADPCC